MKTKKTMIDERLAAYRRSKSPTDIFFRDKISANIRALGEWLFRLSKLVDGPLNQEHRKPWPDFLRSR